MRPGVERDTDVTLTLEVDGEMFSLRQDESDGNAYPWLSGPNPGYGFSSASADGLPSSLDDHEEAIRNFLSHVDPDTGYIE